ncbi:MAG TPA: HEAT repeat domain-containing protein [Pirellulales bacterium]|nr:HEAT repeat domain-containing protein [Pirellulales bacterium]
MYLPRAVVLSSVLTMGMAMAATADDAQLANLTKTLASGDSAAQLKATDDIVDLGPAAKPTVPALIKALNTGDAPLQWHAARALSAIGPAAKDAVPALTAALKSNDAMVRGYAANALEEIGDASQPAVPELVALLSDKNGNVRRKAIDALVAMHLKFDTLAPILKQVLEQSNMDPALVVPALNALADAGDDGINVLIGELKNDKAVHAACIGLADAGPKAKAAVPELIRVVQEQDKHPAVRREAIMALAAIGPDSKSAGPQLVKALSDQQYAVRYAAALAVGQIGIKDAAPQLAQQLDSDDPFLKMISAWALAKINPDDKAGVQRAVSLLVTGLKDPNQHVRGAAARGLLELHAPQEMVISAMSDLLADKDPEVRGNVVDALSSLGEAAVPRLIKALQNDDMQALAVEVLRRLGPKAKDAVPALILELKDPDPEYRREVEFALAAIGPAAKTAVPALIEHLGSDEPRVQYTACYALGKIGPDAADAVPKLRDNMKSDDKFLKVASVWALLHIQPADKALQSMAVPLLAKALGDSEHELARVESANALGRIGAAAKSAIPDLQKAAEQDDSPKVRAAAVEALKKIQAGSNK